MKTKWDLGLKGGSVIANPIPEEYELDFDEMNAVIERAIESAKKDGIRGKDTTPYLLAHIKDYTEGVSLASNLQLAYHNARRAAKIAVGVHQAVRAQNLRIYKNFFKKLAQLCESVV